MLEFLSDIGSSLGDMFSGGGDYSLPNVNFGSSTDVAGFGNQFDFSAGNAGVGVPSMNVPDFSGFNDLYGKVTGFLGGSQGKNLQNVLSTVGTMYNARQARNAANQYRSGVNQQVASLNDMFSPNSPYAQQLQRELARRDAASGRRSQYGPRSVELQAKLAQAAAQARGSSLGAVAGAPMYQASQAPLASKFAAVGELANTGNSLLKMFSNNNPTYNLPGLSFGTGGQGGLDLSSIYQ